MSGVLNMVLGSGFPGNYSLTNGSNVSGSTIYYGYQSAGFGSLTPTAFKSGTVVRLYDIYLSGAFSTMLLAINGFGSDPGQSYFTTIATPAQSLTSASASYSYSSGQSLWTWTTFPLGFKNFGTGAIVPVSLV